ncbi:MAG: ORF6N domain-containing protein [Saprospiraceae bacterium]|nr:ORF6N domain-containing protein [Saprospiraceae bacterium]
METQIIQSKIHTLHGHRVMLDFDLAALYEVEARALNQAVKRNLRRFPQDFMFQLSAEEWEMLRLETTPTLTTSSQIVMRYPKDRGLRYKPYAFTEQGVAMLSSVLRSDKAIDTNIAIMRAFVELRHYALTYSELAQKVAELEAKTGKDIADIHEVLRWLGEENQSRAAEITALEPTSLWLGKSPRYRIQNGELKSIEIGSNLSHRFYTLAQSPTFALC